MKLKIVNGEDKITENGTAAGARGGTELMREWLYQHVDNNLLNKVNIISSRVRNVSTDKPNILWLHDTWNDPEAMHLRDVESRKRFDALVFVSDYQFQTYHMGHGIPYDGSAVLENAITPIDPHDKPTDMLNFIYHTTPHRGLEILVPVFIELQKQYPFIRLDVYSSFNAYGWPHRDEPYRGLFKMCDDHPAINYHGAVSNEEIRESLKKSHIFAYPNIWPETSCIAAIEAMSARNIVICPNLGALHCTTNPWSFMYHYTENPNTHAKVFYEYVKAILDMCLDKDGYFCNTNIENRLRAQAAYTNIRFSWDQRKTEWEQLISSLVEKNH